MRTPFISIVRGSDLRFVISNPATTNPSTDGLRILNVRIVSLIIFAGRSQPTRYGLSKVPTNRKLESCEPKILA